jgi:SulP family sulfate permease
VLEKSKFYELLGKENICSNINEALGKAKATVEGK